MKIYTYAKCGTCRKAIKYLKDHKIPFQEFAIRETPPSIAELELMLKAYNGQLRKLFNTSGRDYQSLGLSTKLSDLSQDEALKLLAGNGNLIKRPFLISNEINVVGFNTAEWAKLVK